MSSSLRGAAAIVLLALAGLGGATGRSVAEPPDRILFVGNSLTAWNDLPLLIESMAATQNLTLRTESVTYANASLEDHWQRDAPNRIRKGGWKYVVLQQGPSSLPSSRDNLREWTKRFSDEIRRAGAIPALFMVWPDQSRRKFFPDVSQSYRLACLDVDGILVPVGDVWLAVWTREPALGLYGPDQFHPSALGTYAAAVTFLSSVYGIPAEQIRARFKLRNGADYAVDEAQAAVVRAGVVDVIRRATP